jgi:hypothetical protein
VSRYCLTVTATGDPSEPRDRPATGPVADIGCRSGQPVRCLVTDGYEAGLGQVQQGDYLELPEGRTGELAATATDLLEHLTKPEVLAAFDAVATVLRPSGRFVARVPAVIPFGGHIVTQNLTFAALRPPSPNLPLPGGLASPAGQAPGDRMSAGGR